MLVGRQSFLASVGCSRGHGPNLRLQVCRRLVYDGAIATGFQLYGVWPLTSLMRHSCIPSANYVALGELPKFEEPAQRRKAQSTLIR
eukprot:4344229-Amphidinium_carterae.1